MPVWWSGAVPALLAVGCGLFGSLGPIVGDGSDDSPTGQQDTTAPPVSELPEHEPTATSRPTDLPHVDREPTTPSEPAPPPPTPPPPTPPPPASPPTRKAIETINGVYVLGLEDRPAASLNPLLADPAIDGLSLRAGWIDVEPREGSYDWSLFDSGLAAAVEYGKKVMLRVLPGVKTPAWVYEAGAAQFEFVDVNPYHETSGQTLHMPVPWDPVYLEKWRQFVAAFGAAYAGHPNVTIVAISGPAAGGEMHLGDEGAADRWCAVGYSDTTLVDTWKQAIDAFTAAFPRQHLTIAIAHATAFGDPDNVVEQVVRCCAEAGCGIQGNWLAARTEPQNPLYRRVAAFAAIRPVGFQTLSAAGIPRFGGNLRPAVNLALKAHASYLELYLADLSTFPEDVAYAHEQLTGTGKP